MFFNKLKSIIKNKKVIIALLSFILIIFVVSVIFSVRNTIDFFSKIHSSNGVVLSVNENNDNEFGNYSYEIEFYDKTDDYCSVSINSNKVYDVDDIIKVYYANSDDVYLERGNPIIIIIPIICIGLAVILILLYRDNKTEEIETKELMNENNIIFAKIENVTRKDIDDKRFYNIVCSWIDPNDSKNYTFVSEDLDFDPTMSINVSNKNSLNVYLDKNNYNNYIVDVNEIKNNKF